MRTDYTLTDTLVNPDWLVGREKRKLYDACEKLKEATGYRSLADFIGKVELPEHYDWPKVVQPFVYAPYEDMADNLIIGSKEFTVANTAELVSLIEDFADEVDTLNDCIEGFEPCEDNTAEEIEENGLGYERGSLEFRDYHNQRLAEEFELCFTGKEFRFFTINLK